MSASYPYFPTKISAALTARRRFGFGPTITFLSAAGLALSISNEMKGMTYDGAGRKQTSCVGLLAIIRRLLVKSFVLEQ